MQIIECYRGVVKMAEFCIECLRKFEPNANENNVVLSDNPELCEGCGMLKNVVIEINDEN